MQSNPKDKNVNDTMKPDEAVASSLNVNAVEPIFIGGEQRDTHHKMIECVKEYHSKLDVSQHKGIVLTLKHF